MVYTERLTIFSEKRLLLRWGVITGLCLATVWLYREALPGYFLSDDLSHMHTVVGLMQGAQPWSRFFTALVFPPDTGGFFYRPLLIASFTSDFLLWGLQPFGWHVTNLAFHVVNIILLWMFVARLVHPERSSMAFGVGAAAATLFAVRPTSPEPVVWLCARMDLFALCGMLVSLYAYLQAQGRWNRLYLVSLGGFVFALGSKEAGVTLPAALAALHLAGAIPFTAPLHRGVWRAWLRQLAIGVGPFVLLLFLYFVFRFFLFGSFFRVYLTTPPIHLLSAAWWEVKLHALRFFLTSSLVMTPLSVSFASLILVMAVLGGIAAWYSPAARRVWLFGLWWLMATLLPMMHQFAIAPTGEGARLLYIPSAALCLLLATPLVMSLPLDQPPTQRLRILGEAGIGVGCFLLVFSLLLQAELLAPWVVAGKSMRALTQAVAARADRLATEGFAALLIPDHVDGALFGRNGQGALMEPPVQPRNLLGHVVVLTPETLEEHGPQLASPFAPHRSIERWCWNVEAERFELLAIPDHAADLWRLAWLTALQSSPCRQVTEEMLALAPSSR